MVLILSIKHFNISYKILIHLNKTENVKKIKKLPIKIASIRCKTFCKLKIIHEKVKINKIKLYLLSLFNLSLKGLLFDVKKNKDTKINITDGIKIITDKIINKHIKLLTIINILYRHG